MKKGVKIKKIVLEIKGKETSLTLEECQQLKTELENICAPVCIPTVWTSGTGTGIFNDGVQSSYTVSNN